MSLYDEILESLEISPQRISKTAERFSHALADSSDCCGLKMLDSLFNRPAGNERGEALGLDFGGTNLRLFLVQIGGRGFRLVRDKVINIRHDRLNLDLTQSSVDGSQLFDYIAAEIGEMVDVGQDLPLGHCFSFPFRQADRNTGVLQEWTKEIKTGGVVGQDVNRLLEQALLRQGLVNIKPTALLNDTVAALLWAAYLEDRADIGSICGSGHNSSLVDGEGRIINVEAGNFHADILPINRYDTMLDHGSSNRGAQSFEKMVAGVYLGELLRLMLLDLSHETGFFPSLGLASKQLTVPNSIHSHDISSLLASGILSSGGKPVCFQPDEQERIQRLALALVKRAARLIAAAYLGIAEHLDPGLNHHHLISIDGSLYEKMPWFAAFIRTGLDEVMGERSHRIETRFLKDSSGLGAALAAIITTGP